MQFPAVLMPKQYKVANLSQLHRLQQLLNYFDIVGGAARWLIWLLQALYFVSFRHKITSIAAVVHRVNKEMNTAINLTLYGYP